MLWQKIVHVKLYNGSVDTAYAFCIIQTHMNIFEVDTFNMAGGIFESLNCDRDYNLEDTFGVLFECEAIPPVYDTLLFSLKINSDTNISPGRIRIILNGLLTARYVVLWDTTYIVVRVHELNYERGDLNHNGTLGNEDIDILTNYVYYLQSFEYPLGGGDVNSDGAIDIEDILPLRNSIFR